MRRKSKASAFEYSFGQRPRALGHNWKGASQGALTGREQEKGEPKQTDGSRKMTREGALANPPTGAAPAAPSGRGGEMGGGCNHANWLRRREFESAVDASLLRLRRAKLEVKPQPLQVVQREFGGLQADSR